jgi:hypothetical protein
VTKEGLEVAQPYALSGQLIREAPEFFGRLNQADLPELLRRQIGDTLAILLEDDGETVAPNIESFSALLRYLAQHREVAAPAIGVNHDRLFIAVWQEPGFRLSYEFEPAGHIHWLLTENSSVQDGRDNPEKAPRPPRTLRAFA